MNALLCPEKIENTHGQRKNWPWPFSSQKDSNKANKYTFASAIKYLVENKPKTNDEIKGVILRKPIKGGQEWEITETYIDNNNKLICHKDGTPYGRKVIAKQLDDELREAFADSDLIIAL